MAECLLPSSNNNAMAIKIINFFIDKGLTPNQALGICANVFGESGYRTTPMNDESGAYGLFQWTGSRKSALKAFCQKNGFSISNATAQLNFAWHENDRNVWDVYAKNKGMTAMQSLDYWEDNWERCFNSTGQGPGCKTSKEACCHHSSRQTELKRLSDLYNKNVKSSNCNTEVGDGGDVSTGGCDPSSMAYADGDYQNSDETQEKKKYYSDETPYEPLGKDAPNNKPVFFGGTWAHYMSWYMAENDNFFTYTVTDGKLETPSLDGKKRWFTFGGQRDYIQSDTVSNSILHHIKSYLSKKGNNPKYIVVFLDISALTFSGKPKTKAELISQMTQKLTKFLQNIKCRKVILPNLVKSWQISFNYNGISFDYTDFNKALNAAARRAGTNFITFARSDASTNNYMGNNICTILPKGGFEAYANAIKNYCMKNA